MPEPRETLWSGNSNAPRIPYDQYFYEKAGFAGSLIGSILYGIVVMLSFQCMTALLSPVHHRGERIKWGLVSYTTLMFSVVTALTATSLNTRSVTFIDNREFPGVRGAALSGPLGYQSFIDSKALGLAADVLFFLNGWLADGLLLYRCHIIYAANFWVIAFPCLMYLSSVAIGIIYTYQSSRPENSIWKTTTVNLGLPYLSISIALNILLTLMIVTRLILHTRNIRTAMGITGIGGLCMAIATMLIESSALYAVSSLLVIVPWAVGNHAESTFFAILTQTQVIAPLLIIQRVAHKRALTSNTVVSGHVSELKVRSPGVDVR